MVVFFTSYPMIFRFFSGLQSLVAVISTTHASVGAHNFMAFTPKLALMSEKYITNMTDLGGD